MPNFFTDNQDLQFLFNHLDLAKLAEMQQFDFRPVEEFDAPHRPENAEDAVDNYLHTLEIIGQVAGDVVAPGAEEVDREGNTLDVDAGRVAYHPNVQKNLKALSQARVMGFTLPEKFGGLNAPCTVYTMATEIIARADASLMNLFGLQGIAETINAFASNDIRYHILPQFCEGKVTAAMALTEPDAGSDLLAVRLRAEQDENGDWKLNGVKRFITNGCGEVLLVLALSHPEEGLGRGLSFFFVERDETLRVRHLEDKLGIHGSPTCEIVFTDTPAKIVGDPKRGMIYTMEMMNGARMGIAAQSLGIGEAAYRMARTYANSREQFGTPIEKFPAVAQIVTDMAVHLEAGRALTYESAASCDVERTQRLVMETQEPTKEEKSALKKVINKHKRFNKLLTPMSKYFCSEMSIKLANQCIQVLGGSGFIKDYAAERYLRDSRITTLYEGTSQLQVVAAGPAIISGAFATWTSECLETKYEDAELQELKEKVNAAREVVIECAAHLKASENTYRDLMLRNLVDMGITVVIGNLLLDQAAVCERKKLVVKLFLDKGLLEFERCRAELMSGSQLPLDHYEEIAGPVPEVE